MNDLVIYTDGACIGNGKAKNIGGWSFVIIENGKLIHQSVCVEFNTTNNRQELLAVIRALQHCVDNKIKSFTLYSDSQYVVNGYNSWMIKWQRRGWVRGQDKNPIPNDDLWKILNHLKELLAWRQIEWVRGHSGNKWNEYADRLIEIEMSKHPFHG